jgi:hypothetical protein
MLYARLVLYLCHQPNLSALFDVSYLHSDGITYERHSIETHFEKIGEFDPLTRKPCTKKDLIPNLSLREAIEDFLAENGWAAGTLPFHFG